jgi:hypothetical protein
VPGSRRRRLSVAVMGALALGLLAAAEPGGVQRQPGEMVLSEEEQAEVLRGADDRERDRLAALFGDEGAYMPVAYTRALFRVTTGRDGGAIVTEVAPSGPRPGSHLRLPDARIAAASGSTSRYDLYASVGIARLSGPGYRWVIASFFRWYGMDGIDFCNRNEDSIATAWAGGLALHGDSATGAYRPFGQTVSPLDIYRSDVGANIGVGWSFHELKQRTSQACSIVNWGEGDAYIGEPSWQSRTSNVTMKYVHTKGSTSYSMGFSVPGGMGPSISVSPADSNQWTAAAFATFNH